MNLADLSTGEKAIIAKVRGQGSFRKRIIEMGFIAGNEIKVIKNAPLKDPVEYEIMGYEISLRRSEAALIEVIHNKNQDTISANYRGTITEDEAPYSNVSLGKTINIALVGNPNCGKTTLFNYVSKSNEHVGNYGGVTVDSKTAKFKHKNYLISLVDLPGTYSLTAYSPEELFVRQHLAENLPDIVVNVIDASNLERNLYLTTQLIDMNIKVIIALNMYDEMVTKGVNFDFISFGKMLGIPVIPTVSIKGKGTKDLFDKAIDVFEDKEKILRHIHINYGSEIENAIKKLEGWIKHPDNTNIHSKISPRFLAVKLLEKDKEARLIAEKCAHSADILSCAETEIKKIEQRSLLDTETLITDSRYGFIKGALKETLIEEPVNQPKKSSLIDRYLTHRIWGFPIFIFFLWFMFFATFNLGSYPMNWIESLVRYTGNILNDIMPAGILRDLLIDGIIGGVGGVIIFLPNIILLFFFISLMEDTGYMARVAFIMDRLMHKIGLHGKSFIPMIMGFGCNVPAIMAARTIENRNDRLLTILINPFMSCSARLPVYVLLISAFFPDYPSLVLFMIYIIGIILAVIMSILFKRIFFRAVEAPFVMELPPYRVPAIRNTLRHMWFKAAQYLKKIGGIILIASIIIWALGYFPINVDYSKNYDQLIQSAETRYMLEMENQTDQDAKTITEKSESEIHSLMLAKQKEHQEKSLIGIIGRFMEPVIKPLGFDWRMGVSLFSGIAAKEIVVSTMGVLYMDDAQLNEDPHSLVQKIKSQEYPNGKKVFNPIVAISFMLFILIYFPCIGVIATIKREAGGWKWALFTVFYTTTLAWVVSFLFYQIAGLF